MSIEKVTFDLGDKRVIFPRRYYVAIPGLTFRIYPITKDLGYEYRYIKCFSHSGYVREQMVDKVLSKRIYNKLETYLMIYMLGDYLYQITEKISENIDKFNFDYIRQFVLDNTNLYLLIKSRVISYWNMYYRYSEWSNFYRIETPSLKDYKTYSAIKYIEEKLKNDYGLYFKGRKLIII